MFGLFNNPFQRQKQQQPATAAPQQQNPVGAEYNVPFQNIAPGPNQVNIQGDAGAPDDQAAFQAFATLYAPMIQNQMDMIGAMSLGAQAPEVQRSGMQFGDQPVAAPSQYGQEDITNSLLNMFQRAQAGGILSRYRGFSNQQRRRY